MLACRSYGFRLRRKRFHGCESQEMFLKNPLKPLTTNSDHEEDDDRSPIKMSGILHPHRNDVLMGRGGKNNQHSGNEKLREIARERCEDYQAATKKGKSRISKELVQIVREMNPPGRFLRKVNETSQWEDVGDDIAREKTSQVLRDAVAYQMFGPNAKSHKHKGSASGNSTARTKGFSEQMASQQSLMSPIAVVGNSISNIRHGLGGAHDIEEASGDLRVGGRHHTDSPHGSTVDDSPLKAFPPMWHTNQQRNYGTSPHRYSPASSADADVVHQGLSRPPYLGVMRDPGSASDSSAFSRSLSSSLHSVTPASTNSSTTSSTAGATRKRPRYQYFESPPLPSSYYDNSGTTGGSQSFASPQPYYVLPLPANTPPPVVTNTSPVVTSSTTPPPFARNTSQHRLSNSNVPSATDMLCSPHDASQFRSPNNYSASCTSYYPGARFATANSPGAFHYHASPQRYGSSTPQSSAPLPMSSFSSPRGMQVESRTPLDNRTAQHASSMDRAGFSPEPVRVNNDTDSIRRSDFYAAHDPAAVHTPGTGTSIEDMEFFQEEFLSDSERDGAISPFPFSTLKLEDDQPSS